MAFTGSVRWIQTRIVYCIFLNSNFIYYLCTQNTEYGRSTEWEHRSVQFGTHHTSSPLLTFHGNISEQSQRSAPLIIGQPCIHWMYPKHRGLGGVELCPSFSPPSPHPKSEHILISSSFFFYSPAVSVFKIVVCSVAPVCGSELKCCGTLWCV